MQDNKVISLPPLTFPPAWAVELPLMNEDIRQLQIKVQQALEDLSQVAAIVDGKRYINSVLLAGKNKEPKLLEEVQNELRNMKCSTDQTKWLDQARTLADNAYASFDECFRVTTHFVNLLPNVKEAEFRRHIINIQKCQETAKHKCEYLNNHLKQLLNSSDALEKQTENNLIDIRSYQPDIQENSSLLKESPSLAKVDIFSLYKAGVKKLIDELGNDHSRLVDVLTYEARLLENIDEKEKNGDYEGLRANRYEILRGLNRVALEELGKSFNELCGI
ncbi:hypothetical protein Mic7113_6456 (plasmid) [Allocoleopsis franciscana PCC 7113]|uniref:Uncharacterized protein n=2 Tax=Allocoleopsis TaxID=2886347 RepID=K9WQF9_9CYAN|nr:hypothetical protein Mic7113_6456 [Allocoleopsis franciscana PCC 7113]